MNENKKFIIQKWFEKASNDLKNIENNLIADDIPTDSIYFHAQQSIEKYKNWKKYPGLQLKSDILILFIPLLWMKQKKHMKLP